MNPDPRTAPIPRTPYRGWAWRGANLEIAQLSVYTPSTELKHLGVARACLGPLVTHPQIFRIYAHQAWLAPESQPGIAFPENTHFRVLEVLNLGDSRICILLEQCLEGCEWDDSLQDEFDAWLPEVAAIHPQPDPEQVKAWDSPFARWAPEAVEGDDPLSGVFYDMEDAVQFTVAWTHLDEAVVRKVLDAKDRYQGLAGIIDDEVDEARMREREAMRHLLPETPGIIDENEVEYLCQATGLDKDTIHLINSGEVAYLDSLGLIEWEDDDERNDRLGAPDLGR